MINAIYLCIFGLLTIISLFLVFAWGRIAWKRSKDLRTFKRLYHDRYMVLVTALAINAAGSTCLFGGRLISALQYGTSVAVIPGLLGYVTAAGAVTILTAKFGFMWAVERKGSDRWWMFLLAVSVIWTLFALWWELWYIPSNESIRYVIGGIQ